MEAKLNCWEATRCGREPGGKASDQGGCPSAVETSADGVNQGRNGGRVCWAIAGTLCFGHRPASVPHKPSLCQLCSFFLRVQQEEGARFRLMPLALPSACKAEAPEEAAGLRQRVADFDKAKSRFIALLTHQIVSPLATAYTCVSTLRKLAPKLSSQDRESLMQGALDRVVGVQELAKKLLDLAAIQEGRALADCKPVDILEAVRKAVESHADAARAKDIPLLVELPAAASRISADPAGLGIIFGNLLENAIQYSEPGSQVIVSGRAEQGRFLASVRDHGPGIPDQDLPRIFDEFFRGPGAVRTGIAGSGLGLAFVKALVARYGGSICVESQPGRGSTFTVSFPCI